MASLSPRWRSSRCSLPSAVARARTRRGGLETRQVRQRSPAAARVGLAEPMAAERRAAREPRPEAMAAQEPEARAEPPVGRAAVRAEPVAATEPVAAAERAGA